MTPTLGIKAAGDHFRNDNSVTILGTKYALEPKPDGSPGFYTVPADLHAFEQRLKELEKMDPWTMTADGPIFPENPPF